MVERGFFLCTVSNAHNLIAVTRTASDSDNVIVSFKNEGVAIYKISDQKAILTWSTKKGQEITSPTHYMGDGRTLITVFNKQYIRIWNQEDAHIEQGKKYSGKGSIYKTLCLPTVDEPVIVFENGAVTQLADLKDPPDPVLYDDENILYCDGGGHDGKSYVLVLSRREVSGKFVIRALVHWIAVNSGSKMSESQLQSEAGDLLSFCLMDKKSPPEFLTLWSDGSLRSTRLTGSLDHTVKLHNIPDITPSSRMCSVGENHVAVSSLKAGENGEERIGLWNVKFGTLHSTQTLPTKMDEDKRIFCAGSHIFALCGKSIYAFPYTCPSSDLATSLGKYTTLRDLKETLVPKGTAWEGRNVILQESLNQNALSVLEQLVDAKKTPTAKSFTSAFNTLTKNTKKNQWQELASSLQMSKLIKRISEETRFWPQQEIKQLVLLGAVPSGLVSTLISVVVSHEDLSVLLDCHNHLTDIPEPAIVQCLKFYLKQEEATFSRCTKQLQQLGSSSLIENNRSNLEPPFGSEKAAFINLILTSVYNDVFILDSLRAIDFDQVLLLMKYLFYQLSSLSAALATHKSGSRWQPSLMQVVDWLSLLLDAHCQQLILSPDARTLLADLHQVVESQVQFYDELVSLEAILSQLKQKCGLPKKQCVGLYSIEVLHIL
ncbi:nucleolar protein 11 [Lingula anatina]|uniref:Nucleolar protein 11 n=1 Tax=Lingula anatina TaxID=7574 RepID=A0A1S3K4Q4_LINAN|nr:nucleolar protein 11 [Lingula anatina]|eukprot:XP_013417613.1 nucleolar protein 11 [Lingula anatina]